MPKAVNLPSITEQQHNMNKMCSASHLPATNHYSHQGIKKHGGSSHFNIICQTMTKNFYYEI
jgi:hypothetical protein